MIPSNAGPPRAGRRTAGVAVAVLAVGLLLGGCRGGDRAAMPAATGSVGSAATAGDQLAGIEATVDAVDREISADAAAPDVAGTPGDVDAGSRPRR